eukprot:1156611-Alexandrium_andersonii.AAC.1
MHSLPDLQKVMETGKLSNASNFEMSQRLSQGSNRSPCNSFKGRYGALRTRPLGPGVRRS